MKLLYDTMKIVYWSSQVQSAESQESIANGQGHPRGNKQLHSKNEE